jgi:hypothetical protein
MGAFGGCPQKAQSLRLDVQIETRQYHPFSHVNHQLITVSRENVGTLLTVSQLSSFTHHKSLAAGAIDAGASAL